MVTSQVLQIHIRSSGKADASVRKLLETVPVSNHFTYFHSDSLEWQRLLNSTSIHFETLAPSGSSIVVLSAGLLNEIPACILE